MAALASTMLGGARAPRGGTEVALVTRGSQTYGGATVTWDRTIAVDTDARRPLQHVARRLAAHYRDSLLAGLRQDTGGPLPRDADGSPVAVRTGWMARNWLVGRTAGSERAAQLDLQVNTSSAGPVPEGARPDGRRRVVEQLARRSPPILLQSLDGRSREVFERATAEALAMVFPEVRTPTTGAGGGTIAQLGGRR